MRFDDVGAAHDEGAELGRGAADHASIDKLEELEAEDDGDSGSWAEPHSALPRTVSSFGWGICMHACTMASLA